MLPYFPLFQTCLHRFGVLCAVLAGVIGLGQASPAQAGCGCDKPPPELAQVRPNVTYTGLPVSLFHANLQSGQTYSVTFTSGISGESVSVSTVAVTRRDVADNQYKPQLVVVLPAALPLGPTSISLADQSGTFSTLADAAFTLAPQPLMVPTEVGESSIPNYQAAVGRNGVVYISLDVSAIQHPRTFQAQALGYPLRFTNNDIVFYNTQGFLMQLLEEGMPGLFAIDAASGSSDSDTLQYSRHEFNTYFLQHDERQEHAVDASDANWHLDGTPHIEHDHLIVAIAGMLEDGSLPAPGATPVFDLALSSHTLFQHGLVGDTKVTVAVSASTGSYNTMTGSYGSQGDVWSNGPVSVWLNAMIDGDATASTFQIGFGGQVTGNTTPLTEPLEFLPVAIPNDLENLGSIVRSMGSDLTLGPGSYKVSHVSLTIGGELIIDNTDGPVTLYITGDGAPKAMHVAIGGSISVLDPNPEKFAVYVAAGDVNIASGGSFYGVIYAPESLVELSSGAELYGAFVGDEVKVRSGSEVYYDSALRGE